MKVGDLVRMKIVNSIVSKEDIGIIVHIEGEGYTTRYKVIWRETIYDGACRKWWLEPLE